jgi:hypothetical protein
MQIKNRIFFDTNTLEILRSSNSIEAPRLRQYIGSRYRYIISPLTVAELLRGIHNGDPTKFYRDKEKALILRGNPPPRVIELPGKFVFREVISRVVEFPGDTRNLFHCAFKQLLRAKSREELQSGPKGVSTDNLNRFHIEEEKKHYRMLENVRSGSYHRPKDALEWVKTSFLSSTGIKDEFHESEWKRIAAAMEIAFAMNSVLCDRATKKANTYNFEKHKSDWIDVQQLFYLAAPDVTFITRDERLRNTIKGICDTSRIITLQEVIEEMSQSRLQ